MPFDIISDRKKADSLRGCLEHLKRAGGRRRYPTDEDPLLLADQFVSDEAKIGSSKVFRRLSELTQVFTLPTNICVRTRLAHTMEVNACAVVMSEMLGLNTPLARSAALGHDIGHTPFGHQGEAWLAEAMGRPFCHEVMGVVIAQKTERRGMGLNLTHETLEAMLCHSGNRAKEGMSQEAWVVRYADKFAYIFADWNDIVVRNRYPAPPEAAKLISEFGSTQRERTTTAISGLIIESAELGHVSFKHSEMAQKFERLRGLMNQMYPHVTQQNVRATMEPVLEFLTLLDLGDPFLLLALMTDKDVIHLASQTMKDIRVFNQTAVSEIVPHLEHIGKIDLCDADLDW